MNGKHINYWNMSSLGQADVAERKREEGAGRVSKMKRVEVGGQI